MIAVITGYLASVLLALSLLVTNELRFRWLNTLGCLAFIIYGVLISAFPIILTNAILLLINIYRIIRTYNTRENFELVEFAADDRIVGRFVDFYRKDIGCYFPSFRLNEEGNDIRFIVLRDMVIANIFIAERSGDDTAVVKINYTVPKYRDFKVGTFLFRKNRASLVAMGVKKIVYPIVSHKGHRAFLKKMGFVTEGTRVVKYLDQ